MSNDELYMDENGRLTDKRFTVKWVEGANGEHISMMVKNWKVSDDDVAEPFILGTSNLLGMKQDLLKWNDENKEA